MERFLHEVGEQQWDVIMFSETWRESRIETWSTQDGHTWFGSGGSLRQRGVGFLLHSRWTHKLFKPISDRIAVLDICVSKGTTFRFIAVYMPHSGQPDENVDAVYAALDGECSEARAARYAVIIGGDLNGPVMNLMMP